MRWLRSRRRKVFGIGLNKTGTTTLGECFVHLGYRHCGYSRELLQAYRKGDSRPTLRYANRFDAFEDWPWPLLYREMHKRFGSDALFVLTLRRDPGTWLESLKKHSLRTPPHLHARKLAYGFDYPHGFEAKHIAFYENHTSDVRRYFADKRHLLLEVCWENGDGWQRLCEFLDCPIPQELFPHARSSSEADERAIPVHREANQKLIDAQIAMIEAKRERDDT